MKLLGFMNTVLIMGYFLVLFLFIAISIVLCRSYLTGKKIKEKTYQLGKDLSNEKVEDYIKFIDSVEIPARRYYWNMIKSGYEIIRTNKGIDIKLVEQLKIVVLSKGILVINRS